jgi:hypothetical protein
MLELNLTKGHQHLGQYLCVHGRFLPKWLQNASVANPCHHLMGMPEGKRGNSENNVIAYLSQCPADPKDDPRTEKGISRQSADELPVTVDNFLNQEVLITLKLEEFLPFLYNLFF